MGVGVEDADEEEGDRGEQDDLEEGVDGDKDGAVVSVAASLRVEGSGQFRRLSGKGRVRQGDGRGLTNQVVPDQDHGNTPGYTNKDEAFAETLFIWKKGP